MRQPTNPLCPQGRPEASGLRPAARSAHLTTPGHVPRALRLCRLGSLWGGAAHRARVGPELSLQRTKQNPSLWGTQETCAAWSVPGDAWEWRAGLQDTAVLMPQAPPSPEGYNQ